MGLFSGIKKIGKSIMSGVGKFLDKIGLSKVLNNKWVKGALLAVSIFTGGVAIVNGIMQGAQAASQATTFLGSFVEGAGGFISGVAQGLASPLSTAGDIAGKANQAMGMGGQAAAGADALSSAELLNEAGTAAELSADALQPIEIGAQKIGAEALQPIEIGAKSIGNPMTQNPPSLADLSGTPEMRATAQSNAAEFAGSTAKPMDMSGWEAADVSAPPTAVNPTIAGLKKMGGAALDYAKSPTGGLMISNMLQGLAEGKKLEEIMKERRRVGDSWQGYGSDSGPLEVSPGWGERSQMIQDRGNQAQSRYGYGTRYGYGAGSS